MKLPFKIGVLLCALFLASIVSGQQSGQTDTSSFSNLTFKVAPIRETFLPMEPIVLNLSLSNNTNSPILGHTYIDFNSAHVDLYVSNQQGDKMEMGGLRTEIANRGATQNKPIPPNYRVNITDVFYTLHRYFPQTGTYTFEFVLRGTKRGEEVRAVPFTINQWC